jgi:hypothetical protein
MPVQVGQIWEMYSATEKRWVRMIVEKIDGGTVSLRYEGVLEFATAEFAEMESNAERFRPAPCA